MSATPRPLATGRIGIRRAGAVLHRKDVWPTAWIVVRLLCGLLNRKDDHGGSIGSTRDDAGVDNPKISARCLDAGGETVD
ncbi:MAG: hypothetical protein R3F36_14360 [Candidatus Competibacteraceae bacterium]